MGSFVSHPVTAHRAGGGREQVSSVFNALADVITKFPRQTEQSKFLLVPGSILLEKYELFY